MAMVKTEFVEFLGRILPHIDLAKKDLYSSGALDSFDIVNLLNAATDEFGCVFDPTLLTPDVFETVDGIYYFLGGKDKE